jgi:hypothetical protein
MRKRQCRNARGRRAVAGRLIAKHARQIVSRTDRDWNRLQCVFGLSFRPGDNTSTFADKLLRPIGTSVAIVVEYRGETMPVHGYSSSIAPDGHLSYRQRDLRFVYDGRLRASFGNADGRLNAYANPSLTTLVLDIDRCCDRSNQEMRFAPSLPILPRIQLGFASDRLPEFEVTSALWQLAARNAAVPLERLDSNPSALVERLLEDAWASVLIAPRTPGNPTDLVLVDAEYCTQTGRALRVFEDFSRMVGCMTWNPARAVNVLKVTNPALAVLERHGIDPANGFEEAIPDERIVRLELEMRNALGELAAEFSQEDIFDGLVRPSEALLACTQAVSAMRLKLSPVWSECATDSDLRNAARDPSAGLVASGACRFQVRQRVSQELRFTSEQLQRRADVDWRVAVPEAAITDEPELALVAQPA